MKHVLATICLVGLVSFAANAHELPVDESSPDATFDEANQGTARVGEILREEAQTLTKDEELDARSDEHIFRDLWDTTKEAVKNGAKRIKDSIVGAFISAKDSIVNAAMTAYQQITNKAAETVSKLLDAIKSIFPVEDSETPASIVETPSVSSQQVAQQPMNVGQQPDEKLQS